MKNFYTLIIVLFSLVSAVAQTKKTPVQMSGIVYTGDSIAQVIPNTNILVKNRKLGTVSSGEGFFSFAALPGDTVVFSALGFKKETLTIPDSLAQKEYLVRVVMHRDTTMLEEVTLYPWPSRDKFKDAFLATRVPATDEDIAMRNLAVQELKTRAAAMGYSPEEIQDYVMQMQAKDIYNYGRYQGFNNGGTAILGALSNPFAWADLFKSIKNGDFKN